MTFWLWFLFGALFGGLAAQKRGWNIAAGVLGGALLGPLSLLLLFVSGSGGESGARGAGAQLGRGVVIALAVVLVAIGALIVAGRMGAFR